MNKLPDLYAWQIINDFTSFTVSHNTFSITHEYNFFITYDDRMV